MLDLPRKRMVEKQIAARGIRDPALLNAFRTVPREAFVEEGFEEFAHEDGPLPIGEEQTISQPYVVALMIEAAELKPGNRVLEVGAGSGYAAAIMSKVAGRIFAIERHASLVEQARRRLRNWDMTTSNCVRATARRAGPRRRPLTPLSSRPEDRRSPRA